MRERLKSLQRLLSVQKDMHRLAEWKLGRLEGQLHRLREERQRLIVYLDNDQVMGLAYSKSIFERLRALDAAEARMTHERDAQRLLLLEGARRMGQVSHAAEAAADDCRRDDEKRELDAAIEAALNRQDASLR
ncbi:MAG: hypothetical protein ACLP8A_02210 [Methylovirgula sp.]